MIGAGLVRNFVGQINAVQAAVMALFAAAGGSSLVGFLQAGAGAVSRTLQSKTREVEVNVRDFGAAVDGATDDAAAWAAAIAYVSGLGGGVVTMPIGVSVTNSQIVVPNFVKLRGWGPLGSVLRAGAAFPADTALVRLGSGAGLVFYCRVEEMRLDCNSVAGSVGVFSTDANEGSGVSRCRISNYRRYGIDFDESLGSGATFNDHFSIDDVELYCSEVATGSTGFHYKTLYNGGQVRRLTVNPNGAAIKQNKGVWVEGMGPGGCHLQIIGINVEQHADGIHADANAGVTVVGGTLLRAGDNLLRIDSVMPIVGKNLRRGTGANLVVNNTIGQSLTTQRLASYEAAWSGNGYQVFTSAGSASTDGNVVSNDAPRWAIKSTATDGTTKQRANQLLLDGNNDGWGIQYAGENGAGKGLRLRPMTAGAFGSSVHTVLASGAIRDLPTANGPVGTFNMGAANFTTVANTAVTANSVILIFATNSDAASLMASSKALYISAKNAGNSFSVSTRDGTPAAGTETFNYLVLN